MKQKQRAAAPHFYVSPTALFLFLSCPYSISPAFRTVLSSYVSRPPVQFRSWHRQTCEALPSVPRSCAPNLYHQRHEMVAAHVAVTQGRNTFSFQTDSRICLGSRFDLILYLAVHRLDADRTPSAAFTKEIGTVDRLLYPDA